MYPHNFYVRIFSVSTALFCSWLFCIPTCAQQKPPRVGRIAVVVDERLSALRSTPDLAGKLIRRVGRGRVVAVRAAKRNSDGIVFLRVNLSSRTHGWMQREALVSPFRDGEDERLLRLILSSTEFDRIVKARIFLDHFPRSRHRPRVLLLFGDTAEEISVRLTRDAARRAPANNDSSAPEFSYYLNYSGLDRYNRQGVRFIFAPTSKRLHYDGATWRELIRRYPNSSEALIAKQRLTLVLPLD